jgi:hypothetical protein
VWDVWGVWVVCVGCVGCVGGQTTKLHDAVDAVAVFNSMMLVPSTLPERADGLPDFAYGDPREAMAAATILLQDIKQHCFLGDPAKFDFKCMEYPAVDTLYKAMGGYGLSGSVTMAGKAKAPISLAVVSYCGFLPAGLQGVANTTNKEHLKANSLRCSEAQRRRWISSSTNSHAFIGRGVGGASSNRQGAHNVASLSPLHYQNVNAGTRQEHAGKRSERQRSERQRSEQHQLTGDRHLLTGDRHLLTGDRHLLTGDRHLLQLAGKGAACIWHDGCDHSVVDPLTGKAGQFCAKGGYCEVCSFCQVDSGDAVDGVCPMSMCPGSGRLPECVSGSKLTAKLWKCKDTYAFQVWRYQSESAGPPKIAPAAAVSHRFMTPGNEVIGGVGMVLRRGKAHSCPSQANRGLQAFANAAGVCLSSEWDSTPFGFDSIFLASSGLYDGNLRIQDFYDSSERRNANVSTARRAGGSFASSEATSGDGMPFAFFPHSYDAVGKGPKNASLVVEYFEQSYIAYLDTRLSSSSAANIVALLKEGGFIDDQVKEIDLHIPVLNVQSMILGLATLQFRWENGGSIKWDYQLQMMKTAPYSVTGNSMELSWNLILLQVLVILMLVFEIIMSIQEVWYGLRRMVLAKHLRKLDVWLDWTSYALQAYYWILWYLFNVNLSKFRLESATTYAPLAEPNSSARWLATHPQSESEWLHLVMDLQSLLAQEAHCYCILGTSLLLFLFRFLAACHFQPKWAPVTGTMLAMIPDLTTYLFLYLLIMGGYAFVGMQLFGHQYASFSTWVDAMQVLVNFMLAGGLDYDACEHAAADNWVFQLYKWTLIVLGMLIMLNIFCCIVIGSYMDSKGLMEATSNTTVDQDLKSTLSMLYNMLTKSTDQFWSDGYLQSVIRIHTKAEGVPVMSKLREHIMEGFNSHAYKSMTLKGAHGGVSFSVKDLKKLTTKPVPDKFAGGMPMFGGQQTGPMQYLKQSDHDESDSDSDSDTDSEAGSLVNDIIERYNEEEDMEAQEQDILEIIKVEGLMRKVSLTQQMSWMRPKLQRASHLLSCIARANGAADIPGALKLPDTAAAKTTTVHVHPSEPLVIRVSKMRARGLSITQPIFGKADAYVLVFVKDIDDDIDQSEVPLSLSLSLSLSQH